MSAAIYYRPIKDKAIRLPGQSLVIDALGRAGFKLPCTFTKVDLDILKGMAATWNHADNPYEAIVDAIEKYGNIEVWVEY